jgi:O-antigen/teichoic acid export membrane protein
MPTSGTSGGQRGDEPTGPPSPAPAVPELGEHGDRPPLLRRAAALSAFEGISTLALSSLANLVLARAAGPTGYAVFVAANLFVFVSTVLAGAGLPLSLARRLGERSTEGAHATAVTTATTAVATALSAFAVGIVVAVASPFVEHRLGLHISGWFTLALPLLIVLAVLSDVGQSAYYGLLRPSAAMAISATGPGMMLLYIVVGRLGSGAPAWGAVTVSYSVSGVLSLVLLGRSGLLSARPRMAELRELLREASSAITYTLFSTFTGSADRWVAGTTLGPNALGGYTSATLLVQATLRAPNYVGYLLVPATRRAAIEEPGGRDRVSASLLRTYAVFAGACTVVLMVAPAAILRFVFGPGFVFLGDSLRLMAPSILAAGVSIPALAAVTGSLEAQRLPRLLVLVLIPRVALLVLCTSLWGLAGTALATTSGEVLLAVGAVAVSRRTGSTTPYRVMLAPFGAAAVAVAVGLALTWLGMPEVAAAGCALCFLAPSAVPIARSLRTTS